MQDNVNSTIFGGYFSNWISLRVNHRCAQIHSAAVGRSGIDGPLTENRSPAWEVSCRVLVLNNNRVLDLESLRRRRAQILALYTVTRQEDVGNCRLPNLWFWTNSLLSWDFIAYQRNSPGFAEHYVRCLIHKNTPILPVLSQMIPIHALSSFFFFFCNTKLNNLMLYTPCIILQHVYKPTRCTKNSCD